MLLLIFLAFLDKFMVRYSKLKKNLLSKRESVEIPTKLPMLWYYIDWQKDTIEQFNLEMIECFYFPITVSQYFLPSLRSQYLLPCKTHWLVKSSNSSVSSVQMHLAGSFLIHYYKTPRNYAAHPANKRWDFQIKPKQRF